MASTQRIPYLEALANQVQQYARSMYYDPDAAYSSNSDLVRPIARAMEAKYGQGWENQLNSNIGLEDFYATAKSAGINEDAFLQARGQGWVDSGYRPGDDLPQFNQSGLESAIELGAPLATMAGLAFGGAGIAEGLGATVGANPLAAGGGGALSSGAVGGGASAGSLMPAAIPESAATLAEWGLVETAPGVWSNVGNAAAFGGLGAAAAPLPSASLGATAPAAGGSAAGTAAGTGAAKATIFDKVLGSPQLLGMGAGALLGSMGGGGEPAGTVTTEQGLPDWLKAYAKPALDQYGTQLQNYNVDPYGIMAGAGQQYRDTINGMYLDPSSNKYLQEYFNAGAERVKGTLSPSFGHMQAFGSHTGYNEALAGGLTDLATGIYGPAYESERNRQAAMTASAPSFLEQSSQAAFSPYQGYLNTISGLGSKKEQPFFKQNPLQGILGGAMAGYGLGNIFK
jgi:hypothetical protein